MGIIRIIRTVLMAIRLAHHKGMQNMIPLVACGISLRVLALLMAFQPMNFLNYTRTESNPDLGFNLQGL